MSTNKTENLGLHSWVRSDQFLMDEFNENFDAIDKAVAAKAEQTALDALTGRMEKERATQTALNELAGRVDALDRGRLRWATGSYKGDGKHGAENPNRLDFDFKPLMVVICKDITYGSYPWVRDQATGRVSDGASCPLTWEKKAVSWYCTYSTSGGIERQLNIKDATYYYFALGVLD